MTRLLVIDTETSGLDPATHSVLALGAVVWDGGQITDTFERYIWEPGMQIDPESLAINQIDLKWLKLAGSSPQVAIGGLEMFLNSVFPPTPAPTKIRLVGHNLFFDIPFLKTLYAKTGYAYSKRFSHRSIDTASILAALILADRIDLPEAGSSAAFEYFGISPSPGSRHTALGDAIATAQLFTELIQLLRQSGREIGAAAAHRSSISRPATSTSTSVRRSGYVDR